MWFAKRIIISLSLYSWGFYSVMETYNCWYKMICRVYLLMKLLVVDMVSWIFGWKIELAWWQRKVCMACRLLNKLGGEGNIIGDSMYVYVCIFWKFSIIF